MDTVELTILEMIALKQDPLALCAGQPVIPKANFEDLATELVDFPNVHKTIEEIVELFDEESKRFSACGANNSDRWGVLRKNPKTGWQYIVDLIE
tara:strand:+ start:3537 stop:3821 length:285 start_codon:yes stop_codon:yes gene_type:complete